MKYTNFEKFGIEDSFVNFKNKSDRLSKSERKIIKNKRQNRKNRRDETELTVN